MVLDLGISEGEEKWNCPDCHGTGKKRTATGDGYTCPRCKGSGGAEVIEMVKDEGQDLNEHPGVNKLMREIAGMEVLRDDALEEGQVVLVGGEKVEIVRIDHAKPGGVVTVKVRSGQISSYRNSQSQIAPRDGSGDD